MELLGLIVKAISLGTGLVIIGFIGLVWCVLHLIRRRKG